MLLSAEFYKKYKSLGMTREMQLTTESRENCFKIQSIELRAEKTRGIELDLIERDLYTDYINTLLKR